MRKSLIPFLFFILVLTGSYSQTIKEADLAGSWYPRDPLALREKIDNYLKEAKPLLVKGEVVALILPHAGIDYSGPVAASGFKVVSQRPIDTVIVIGFSHRENYAGIKVFDREGIETPLGVIYSDQELVKQILAYSDKFQADLSVFKNENSIELMLPFIQTVFNDPKVLLLAIGKQSMGNSRLTAEALADILKSRKNYLIIASTDMSHYLPDFVRSKTDSETAELIKAMDPQELFLHCQGQNRMCGLAPVVSAMITAKKLGANQSLILMQSSSAKNKGSEEKSVGYLSAALVKNNDLAKEEDDMKELLDGKQKKRLLEIARDTIKEYVMKGKILEVDTEDPTLKKVMGVFVTLNKNGQLRGCIGNIIGREPLYLGVRDMAIAAASQDPRFSPLSGGELPQIEIEISVLSPLKKITDPGKIILGTHGVLVKKGFQSGVYLPQVAIETGWDKERFMNSLCGQKAGFKADAWKTGDCEIYIFTAEVFGE